MAVPSTYRGFSTIGAERKPSWVLTDIELIRRDLLNHFYTRIGERVMRPRWGCKIWDYLFEHYSPGVRDEIIEEAQRIVHEEPRLDYIAANIVDWDKGIRIELTVHYKGTDISEKMFLDFERRDTALLGQENWRF